ncbi:MAG: anhydro-N-acetylmuramic acid kinase [Cardiobacteriaceae bacterium]|nr:anhydro-N-acetylmuramic acid kinase [Cardiobacteriaceae bacterium]
MPRHHYIGIMSGTSVDAVDTVLVAIDGKRLELVATNTHPIPKALKVRILDMASHYDTSLLTLGALDRELGVLFAEAVNQLIEKHHIDRSTVRAIGSHGQTVCHRPDDEQPFTMQIGDANQIAALTGIDTVADFRRKDMALGGQGAPLVPAFHHTLFGNDHSATVVLNIGGIANITVLRPGEPVLGYDTGPGNMLMDNFHQQQTGEHYDRDAQVAKSGEVDDALLTRLMAEPYLARPYPKSTGRELFSPAWLADKLQGVTIPAANIQRTLLEYTARTIAEQIDAFRFGDAPQVFVCGGGARNPLLMQRLAELLPGWQVDSTDSQGVSGEYMEAMAFAWLAHRFMERESGNVPEVTGASRYAVLGALYPAG